MRLDSDAAVLVVDAGGRRCAIDLRQVAEIRGIDALVRDTTPNANALGVVHRMGVRVPVYDVRELVGGPAVSDAEAVVVLDLPDRYAALLVDAVCDVRMVGSRLPAPASESAAGFEQAVAWIASGDGGEVPVLDVTSWLLGGETGQAS